MYVIIPARFASTRLPGKPLADVGGKPLIARVYDCARASGAQHIIVATDDARIAQAVTAFGGDVCMTASTHASGTDRIAEAIALRRIPDDATVVNLQGDEPSMPGELIKQVAATLKAHSDAAMATACHALADYRSWINPNITKVVCDAAGYALYFSRAPIPWPRDAMHAGESAAAPPQALRHIGLYAYRAGFVREYAAWPPSPLEAQESLEQLRVLWYGRRIAVYRTSVVPGIGVDTPADLEYVRAQFGMTNTR